MILWTIWESIGQTSTRPGARRKVQDQKGSSSGDMHVCIMFPINGTNTSV